MYQCTVGVVVAGSMMPASNICVQRGTHREARKPLDAWASQARAGEIEEHQLGHGLDHGQRRICHPGVVGQGQMRHARQGCQVRCACICHCAAAHLQRLQGDQVAGAHKLSVR